jgi:type II secretory pathway pseudopilin PulG
MIYIYPSKLKNWFLAAPSSSLYGDRFKRSPFDPLHRPCVSTWPASMIKKLKRWDCQIPNFSAHLGIRRKKRTLTLLEIMIVIVLIGIIGSVVGVNMKGSLDAGRAFKSRQAIEQIQDILMLEVARGTPIEEVIQNRAAYLDESGLVKDGTKFLRDGWGHEFEVKPYGKSGDDIVVTSKRLNDYERKKKPKASQALSVAEDQ